MKKIKFVLVLLCIILLSGCSLFEYSCPEGEELVGDECLSCPDGYIMNKEEKSCTMSEEKKKSSISEFFNSATDTTYKTDVKKIEEDKYELTVYYTRDNIYLHIFTADVLTFVKEMIGKTDDMNTLIDKVHFIASEKEEIKYYVDLNEYKDLTEENVESKLIIMDKDKNVINKTVSQIQKDYISEYKKNCKTYDYKTIFRYAEDYKGKEVKFTGKVVQVIESDTMPSYRINVTKDKWGYYDDTIYVSFFDMDGNTPRILEDDIVTVYGTLSGTYTYETVLGASVTIPSMLALYIDIK